MERGRGGELSLGWPAAEAAGVRPGALGSPRLAPLCLLLAASLGSRSTRACAQGAGRTWKDMSPMVVLTND